MKSQRPAVSDVADEIVAQWRAELPEVAGLPLELLKRVARLAGRFYNAADDSLGPLGLQKMEFGVLATLRRVGAPYQLRPSQLAQQLFLSSGGTSNILRRLEAAGLIKRVAESSDQRSTCVSLTREGVRVAESAVRAWSAGNNALLAPVPEAMARKLADLLREVLVVLGDTPQVPRSIRTRALGANGSGRVSRTSKSAAATSGRISSSSRSSRGRTASDRR